MKLPSINRNRNARRRKFAANSVLFIVSAIRPQDFQVFTAKNLQA